MEKKKTYLRDGLFVLVLLLLTAVLFLFLRSRAGEGGWAVVKVESKEVARYPLTMDGTYVLNGGTNVLTVSGGKARMSEAQCPDKLCVKQGAVSYTGQCITCLPNKLTVTIEGGDDSVELVL